MLSNTENVHDSTLQQAVVGMTVGEELLLEGQDSLTEQQHIKAAMAGLTNTITPAASRRESFGSHGESTGKRRGRPRGWTDARIHAILSYLERNMLAYRTHPADDFYANLCMALNYDLNDAEEIRDKLEKMVKKYESDTRRGDGSWKWYARLNQVFDGPPMPVFQLGRPLDDDAASSSIDSADEEESLDPEKKRVRGEDPFADRLEHEKLLLKLKKLKSKTEMRHREWEATMQKQAVTFEEMKAKTNAAIVRLEKSIVNAGYLLDQSEILGGEEQPAL